MDRVLMAALQAALKSVRAEVGRLALPANPAWSA